MNRAAMTDQLRRIRQAELRDPVENALHAFISLSPDDKKRMIDQFNQIFGEGAYPSTLLLNTTRPQ